MDIMIKRPSVLIVAKPCHIVGLSQARNETRGVGGDDGEDQQS